MGFTSGIHEIIFNSDEPPKTLAPGKTHFCKGECGIKVPQAIFDFCNPDTPPAAVQTLSFEGFAKYTGATNVGRRSAYYRPYDFNAVRFRPSDDPEKEYPG
jgi:hypothetical protein